MKTTPTAINTIDQAISAAIDAHQKAERIYKTARRIGRKTEALERIAESSDEMQAHWAAEAAAYQEADKAAESARIAGECAAQFATHPVLGNAAMAAASLAFKSALNWI